MQTLTLSKETYEDPFVADMVIATELKRYNVDYVVMAGYMRKVGVPILNTFLQSCAQSASGVAAKLPWCARYSGRV